MDKDTNPLPEIHLFPTTKEAVVMVGKAVLHLVHFMPEEAPDFMSNHYEKIR